MGRIFLYLVLLAVSLYVVKLIRTRLDIPLKKLKQDKKDNNVKKQNANHNANEMIKCLHCGLHIPEKEAIKQGDKVFCSLEHARREL